MVSCELDGKPIFKGEIKKAPGNTKDPEACCEIILFTENDSILERIDESDWLNEHELSSGFDDTQAFNDFQVKESNHLEDRPMTATKKFSTAEIEELQFQLQQQQSKPTSLFDDRPQTSAIVNKSQRIGEDHMGGSDLQPVTQRNAAPFQQRRQTEHHTQVKPKETLVALSSNKGGGVVGKVIQLNITESWGDLFYVGLNGLEVLN